MSWKMRPAPARAMTTLLSCWETWLMGWVKLRESCMNEAMVPSVNAPAPPRLKLGTPAMASEPPMMAMST